MRIQNTDKMKISVIGTGAVGSRIAVFLKEKNFHIHALVNRPKSPSRELIKRVQPVFAGKSYSLCSDSHVIFLTIPDPELESAAAEFRTIRFHEKRVFLIHTSGSHSAGILKEAKKNPFTFLHTGSMHPMQTFPKIDEKPCSFSKPDLNSIFFGIEGDEKCLSFLRSFLRHLDCAYGFIPSGMKLSYHLGGIFASNFLVALIDSSLRLYAGAGWNRKKSKAVIFPLIEETLRNCLLFDPAKTLTGPASRNDRWMIQQHMKYLNKLDPVLANAYHALTEVCLKMKGFQH